jgi:hypothetical protein
MSTPYNVYLFAQAKSFYVIIINVRCGLSKSGAERLYIIRFKTLICFRYINVLDYYLVEMGVKINFLINIKAKDNSVLLVFFNFYREICKTVIIYLLSILLDNINAPPLNFVTSGI